MQLAVNSCDFIALLVVHELSGNVRIWCKVMLLFVSMIRLNATGVENRILYFIMMQIAIFFSSAGVSTVLY